MKDIFFSFLKLGCHAFGGPTAHFGYFHNEYVKRRQWISEEEFADTVALCQFLPGPSSSQTGFAIGLKRGGILGAFLAWIGFTLPSAVLMIAFAIGISSLGDLSSAGWIDGLKLVAVAVVANAALGMASSLCKTRSTATIAIAAAILVILVPTPSIQVLAIAAAALLGARLFRSDPTTSTDTASPSANSIGKSFALACAALFFILLFGLPTLAQTFPDSPFASVADAFYRAGSLVFGGGHVVLPLLESYTVGENWIDESTFLAGYGAAQALPGPLFAFSSFLGASLDNLPSPIMAGVFALLMIYLPSWLLVFAATPFWQRLRQIPTARAALIGTNAAVVGILFAALYQPIWTSSIHGPETLAIALAAFAAIRFWKLPPWLVAAAGATIGHALL